MYNLHHNNVAPTVVTQAKKEKYLERLSRRADYLAKRIAGRTGENRNTSYDQAELSALLWAIEEIQSHFSHCMKLFRP